MIEEILPGGVAAAELWADAAAEGLYPEERALVEGAVRQRRAEFAAGRVCARRALWSVGFAPKPILRGPDREPIWPSGVVGSLTHCHGYRAAALALSARFLAIGIDAEPDEPLPDGVLERISLPVERPHLDRSDGPHLDRLLFSAKECVYKAWFPIARGWLGFHDAKVVLRPDRTFDVRVLVPGPLDCFHGRWMAHGGLVVTAIALARAPSG